jgi:putative transposase
MVRQKRNFNLGKIYYVTQRGVENRRIFIDKEDCFRFITALEFFNCKESINLWRMFFCKDKKKIQTAIYKERLSNKKKKRIVDFLAFMMVPNSYAFLLREIEEGGISLFMQKIGGYAYYFNQRYQRRGTLFSSRYRAVNIERERLKAAFCYIHTKTVDLWKRRDPTLSGEKVLERLYKYRCSSLLDYLGKHNFPSVTNRGFFLDVLGGRRGVEKEIDFYLRNIKKI